MRVHLPRFDALRLGLRPGCYELPSHIEISEVRLLLELLARALDGIEDVLECDWFELDQNLAFGSTTLLFVTIPEQVEADGIAARLARLPVRFCIWQHADTGHWPEVAWDEIEVKSALAAGLRMWVRKPTNPLAPLDVARLPIDLLVGATSEPIELLVLMQITIAYALRQRQVGESIDWETCARWSIAQRLAERLAEIAGEFVSRVREAIEQSTGGALDVLQYSREVDELARVGLAHRHEGDAILVPLARFAADDRISEFLDIEGVTTPTSSMAKPTQQRATTPTEAIIACDPLTPVEPGDPWFVDLRTVVPEIGQFAQLFVQQVARRDRNVRLEILHESGAGATTMVRTLLRELATSGLVAIDVCIRPSPDFGFVDLLLRTLSAILAHCEESKLHIDERTLMHLRGWLALFGLQGEPRDYLLLGVDVMKRSRLRSVLTLLEGLIELINGSSRERERIRVALEAHRGELLDQLTRVLDEVRAPLLARGQRLCLHYQGSAQFGPAMGHAVFGMHAEKLARLDCQIVFGVTWATRQELSDESRSVAEYQTLDYPSFAGDSEAARAVVEALLAARVELEQVFVRPEQTVKLLAARSDGNPRKSLELAKQLCEMSVGMRLSSLRRRQELTRKELGKRANMSPSSVAKVEHGFEIDRITLARLAAALGVEIDDLTRPGPAILESNEA